MKIVYEKVRMVVSARVKMYSTSGLSKMQVLVLCILAIRQDQKLSQTVLLPSSHFATGYTATSLKYYLF